MKVDFKYTNGQKVKDVVSGLEGVIDSACICLNGCKKYTVQPPAKDGTKPDAWWVDEASIRLLDKKPVSQPEEDEVGGFSTRGPSSKV